MNSVTDRRLYNPAFIGTVATQFVIEHESNGEPPLLDVSVVAVSMAVTGSLRHHLPQRTNARLSNWAVDNASVVRLVNARARAMNESTRRGVLFALTHDWLSVQSGRLVRGSTRPGRLVGDEGAEIVKAAQLLGRWFAKSGNPATVLAVLGVQL